MKQHFDLDYLYSITEGNRELERQLFVTFTQTAQRCLAVLERETQVTQAWRNAAHELGGAAASLGAVQLMKLCGVAETLEMNAELEASHFTGIKNAYHSALNHLQHFLQR